MAWEISVRDEFESRYGIKIMNNKEMRSIRRFLELTAPFLKILGIKKIWSRVDLLADDNDTLGVHSRFRYRDTRVYGRIVLDIDPSTLSRVTAGFDNKFTGGVMVCAGDTDYCTAVAYDETRNNFVVGNIINNAEDYDKEEVKEFVLAIVGVMFALAGKQLPPIAPPTMSKAYKDAVRMLRIVDVFAGVATRLIRLAVETPPTLPFTVRGWCKKAEFLISDDEITITVPIKRKGGRIIVNRSFTKNNRDLDIPSTILPFSAEGSVTLEYKMGRKMVLKKATGKVMIRMPNGDTVKHPNISESGNLCLGSLESKISEFSYDEINEKEFCGWVDDIATRLETMLANPHVDADSDTWGGPMLKWLQRNLRRYSEGMAKMVYGVSGDEDDYDYDEDDDYNDYDDYDEDNDYDDYDEEW